MMSDAEAIELYENGFITNEQFSWFLHNRNRKLVGMPELLDDVRWNEVEECFNSLEKQAIAVIANRKQCDCRL